MSPDHLTAGAYNRNIDKHLARNMVWLRETIYTNGRDHRQLFFIVNSTCDLRVLFEGLFSQRILIYFVHCVIKSILIVWGYSME